MQTWIVAQMDVEELGVVARQLIRQYLLLLMDQVIVTGRVAMEWWKVVFGVMKTLIGAQIDVEELGAPTSWQQGQTLLMNFHGA